MSNGFEHAREMKERLRLAVASVEAAKAQQIWERRVAKTRAALARQLAVPGLSADAELTLARLVAEVAAVPGPPASGDRWALARALEALRAEGAPSHRVVRVLGALGWCPTPTPEMISKCVGKARQERRRYRLANAVTQIDSDPLAAPSGVDTLSMLAPGGAEENDMAPKLMRRTTITEVFEADPDEAQAHLSDAGEVAHDEGDEHDDERDADEDDESDDDAAAADEHDGKKPKKATKAQKPAKRATFWSKDK